ncbi:MAG: hypothetical protein IJX78_06545 [Bacilli bacterium]|nr:hypothetical protein [Bacilli bacterium]
MNDLIVENLIKTKQYTKQIYFSHKQTYKEKKLKLIKKVWHIVLFLRQDKSLPQLMIPVMTTRLLRNWDTQLSLLTIKRKGGKDYR